MASPERASIHAADQLEAGRLQHVGAGVRFGPGSSKGGTPKIAPADEPISVAPESWTPETSKFFGRSKRLMAPPVEVRSRDPRRC